MIKNQNFFIIRPFRRVTLWCISLFHAPHSAEPVWEELPKLLTLRQTAKILRVHANTLRTWDQRGRLRAVRIGSRGDRRYPRAAVQAVHAEQVVVRAPLAKLPWRPYVNAWKFAVPIVLMLIGTVAGMNAWARETQPQIVQLAPQACQGWEFAANALQADAVPAENRDRYTTGTAAWIKMADVFVRNSEAGIVTGQAEQIDPVLTCQDFSGPVADGPEVTSAEAVVLISATGPADSNDIVFVERSLDGTTWETIGRFLAGEQPLGPTTFALPGIAHLADFKQLQLRLRTEFEFQSAETQVAVDAVMVAAHVKEVPASNPEDMTKLQSELDDATKFTQPAYRAVDAPAIDIPKIMKTKFLFWTTHQEEWKITDLLAVDTQNTEVQLEYTAQSEPKAEAELQRINLDTRRLHPGKYTLKLQLESGAGVSAVIEKEFLWGVAAINVTHAAARPGDLQVIGMGVLDDAGVTICDADITLSVKDPKGKVQHFSSAKKTVATSGECVDKGVTNKPDYSVPYRVSIEGRYQVRMEAKTKAGERVVEETFQSDSARVFDVDRFDYPTRIFPLAKYPVRIAVTPQKDFSGLVRERVPANFRVEKTSPAATVSDDGSAGTQQIDWLVDWKKGQTYFLAYTFDAPDLSPALFKTGPLTIGGDAISGGEFSEPRQWQIASDSVSYTGKQIRTIEYVLGTGGLACSGSFNACGSDNNSSARASGTPVYFGNQVHTTKATASTKNIIVKGTGIRVRQAYLEGWVHLVTATNVTNFDLRLDVEASATAGTDARLHQAVDATYFDQSGHDSSLRFRGDVTSQFDRQSDTDFNNGLSVVGAYTVTGPTTILGTMKLILTYEQDYSTTSHTETKTVRFPLDSTVANANGTQASACAASDTTNCNFNYNANIPDAVADADIMDAYFEMTMETNSATASTVNMQITGGTASPNYPSLDTVANAQFVNMIFRPGVGGAEFLRSTAQVLEVNNSAAVALQGLGGELVVTYNFLTGAATQTETIRQFVRQETGKDVGSAESANSAVSTTISNTGLDVKNIWVKADAAVSETVTLTLKGDVAGTVDGTADITNAIVLGGSDSIRAGDTATLYLDLSGQEADFSSATTSTDIERQYNGTNGDAPVGMELFVTFTWTGSSGGTVTKTVTFGADQAGIDATAGTLRNMPMYLALPETVTKTHRSTYLVTTVNHSDVTSIVDSTIQHTGVDRSTAPANFTDVTEQPDEGTTTVEESAIFTIRHDITNTVFSGGSTIAWTERTFTVTAGISQAENAWFSQEIVVTYDAVFGNADPQAAQQKQLRTIEYVLGTGGLTCSGSNNACGSDINSSDRASGTPVYFGNQVSTTKATASTKNIIVKGTGIRVRQAYIEGWVHLVTATNVTTFDLRLDVEASATAGADAWMHQQSDSVFFDQSGHDSSLRYRADVTSQFDRQSDTDFNNGLSVVGGYTVSGPTTILGTMKLILTYEQDYSTTSHTETKTVRFPLDSTVANANGTQISACAASDTTNCNFNYNANIPDAVADGDIMDVYFEMTAETNSATANTFAYQIGTTGTASPNYPWLDAILNDQFVNTIFRPAVGGSDFARSTAQTLQVNNGTVALQGLGGEMVVTYNFSTGAATQTETIRQFVRQETAKDVGNAESANSAISTTISNTGLSVKNIWVKADAAVSETVTLTLKGDVNGAVTSDGNADITNAIALAGSNSIRAGDSATLYLDLSGQAADFSSATTSTDIERQYNGTNGDAPVGMELYVTFTWSGSSGGTVTKTVTFGGDQGGIDLTASVFRNMPMYLALPETVTKTHRSTYLVTNVHHSNAANITDSATITTGVDNTTAPANETTMTEQPDEGTTAIEESAIFTVRHNITNTIFSGGSTIAWTDRTFEVNGNINAAENAWFSHEFVVTYDAALGAITVAQNHFRWRDDSTALNTDGGWLATEDSLPVIDKSTTVRVRIEVANTGAAPATRYPFRLEFATRTGGTCGDETFAAVPVTPTTEHFEMVVSGQYADQDAVTASRLTATGTFANGKAVEDPANNTNAITVTNGNYTELEYAVQATSNAVVGDSYCFRVTNLGSTTNFSYTTYAQVTIAMTITGTCDIYNQSTTDCTDTGAEEFRVAFGGTLQTQLDSTADGTVSITGLTKPSANTIITIFVNSAATNADKAVAVTEYDGTGDITGVVMYEEHLTIGSDDNLVLTAAEIGSYDNSVSADADVFMDYRTDWLNTNLTATGGATTGLQIDCQSPAPNCATFSTQEELYIGAGDTFQPGALVNTFHAEIVATGIWTSGADVLVGGNWDNDGTFTVGTNTVTFNSTTAGTKTIDARGSSAPDFYNVIFNDGAQEVTFQLTSAFDADNDVTITDGTFDANTNNINVAGNWDTNDLFTASSGTLTFDAADTGNTVESGGSSFSNLTFSGAGSASWTIQTNNPTVTGTLNVDTSDTITLASVTMTHSGATLTLTGTIASSGTGLYVYQSATSFPTTGTITSKLRFDSTSNNQTMGARTSYGGTVEVYNTSTTNRTVTIASGTIGLASDLTLNANNTGDITLDGDVNDPTMNITGLLDFTGTNVQGTEFLVAGTSVWTVSGNVDFTNGMYTPQLAALNPTSWDATSTEDQLFINDGGGGCVFDSTTYSCDTSGTGLTAGHDDQTFGGCAASSQHVLTYRTGMKYDLSSINNAAVLTDVRLGTNVTNTTTQTLTIGRSVADDLDTYSCTTAGGLYSKINVGTIYTTATNWNTTGRKHIDFNQATTVDIQPLITSTDIVGVSIKSDESTLDGTTYDSNEGTTKPVLYVGYSTGAAKLVMNGAGTTLTTGGSGLYNVDLSSTITLANEAMAIYGNLNMTGGTITPATGNDVFMNGNGTTLTAGGGTLYDLNIGPAGTGTVTFAAGGSDLTVTNVLAMGPNDTLSIGANRTITLSRTSGGSLNFGTTGTISGSTGRLTYQTSTAFPTDGTISSILRFDATSTDQTMSNRTYGGPVEVFNSSNSFARTVTASAGTLSLSSTLDLSRTGSQGVTLQLDTNDPTTTITGAVTIGAGTTLSANSANALNVNGNYTNNGTFTDNSGTVTLGGGSTQTLSGTMTGSSDFNHLTVANTTGSEAAPGVILNAALDTAGTFTANANTKIQFKASTAYAPTAIALNGSAGNIVYLRSSISGTVFNFNAGGGSRAITYTNVKDSDACSSSPSPIDASGGTNLDAGNTPCWFIYSLSVAIAGDPVNLGILETDSVHYDAVTSTVTTNATSGYVSVVKYNNTLTSGANTIANAGGDNDIDPGSSEYGAATSKSSQSIQTSNALPICGTTQQEQATAAAASALSTTFKQFASVGAPATGDLTTLCLLSSISPSQPAGAYSSTLTIVTTARF